MLPKFTTPAEAIELEAAMVERLRDPSVTHDLQFWTTTQSLIVPASIKRNVNFDKACSEMQNSGWPLQVRKTGGGATPQGPGILNVALTYAPHPSEKPTIHGVYDMFCTPLKQLLQTLGIDASTAKVPNSFCDGEYNIVANRQKVMGTAQRWSRVPGVDFRQLVFAHALILLDAELTACIEAVNDLHRICELEPGIQVDAHANLIQLAAESGHNVDQQVVVDTLETLYRSELVALTA